MVVAPRFDCRACHAVSAYRSKTVPQLVRLQHLVSSLSIPSLQRACFATHPVPCAPQALQNHCRFLACRSSGRFEIVLDASCSSRDLDCMLTNRVNTHGPAHACIRKRKTGSNIGELARLRRLMREEVLVDRCIVFSCIFYGELARLERANSHVVALAGGVQCCHFLLVARQEGVGEGVIQASAARPEQHRETAGMCAGRCGRPAVCFWQVV